MRNPIWGGWCAPAATDQSCTTPLAAQRFDDFLKKHLLILNRDFMMILLDFCWISFIFFDFLEFVLLFHWFSQVSIAGSFLLGGLFSIDCNRF